MELTFRFFHFIDNAQFFPFFQNSPYRRNRDANYLSNLRYFVVFITSIVSFDVFLWILFSKSLFDEHDIDYARVFTRSSNVFYQNYDLYVKREQALLGNLLVAKAKSEADYNNPIWYRNIVFDDAALNMLGELFPERGIKTDYDAVKLVEELRDDSLTELQKKKKEKENGWS